MEKLFVAKRVAEKLWATEAAIDAAMTHTSELMADVLKAPVDMEVSSTVVDKSQAKIMEAMRLLSEARTTMIAAHKELDEAKLRVGVRTKMVGWEWKSYGDQQPTVMTDVRKVG